MPTLPRIDDTLSKHFHVSHFFIAPSQKSFSDRNVSLAMLMFDIYHRVVHTHVW